MHPGCARPVCEKSDRPPGTMNRMGAVPLKQAARTAKSAYTQSENIAMSLTARALVRGRAKRFFFVFCNLHHVPLRLFVEPCACGQAFARFAPLFLRTAHAVEKLTQWGFRKNDDDVKPQPNEESARAQAAGGMPALRRCRRLPVDFDAMRKKRSPTEGKTSIGNRSLSEKQVLRPDARGGRPLVSQPDLQDQLSWFDTAR